MMCHLAAPAALNFESFGQLVQNKAAVYGTVCQQHTMPNAQVPYRHSWSATQPLGNTTLNLGGYLMASRGFTGCP